MPKVTLDPGHGMNDPGAIGNDLIEKVLTLKIAKRTAEFLKAYEVDVAMTRTDDNTFSMDKSTDLFARANMANKNGSDYFVSFHINAFDGKASGFETFTFKPKPMTAIHKRVSEIFRAHGFPDRGQKVKNLAVLRSTKMPAVLVEYGFIDNKLDATYLREQEFIEDVAKATAEGIAEDMNLKRRVTEEVEDDMEDISVYVNGKLEKGIGKLSKDGRTYLQVSVLKNKRVVIEEWDNKKKTLHIKTE